MKKLLLILLMMALCVPCAMAENGLYRIEGGDADRVHLRAEPSAVADSLGLYYTGTEVAVTGMDDGWARVLVGAVNGYIKAEYLTRDAVGPRAPWYKVANPKSDWANLRRAPSMDGTVITGPWNGTPVRILGETANGWSYVQCGTDTGYMLTSLLAPMENAHTVQRTTILACDGPGPCIHRYIAPNGQEIYFTSDLEEPLIEFVDVDFDGYNDIVVTTGIWAKAASARFYRYDPRDGDYCLVPETAIEEGLLNYALYPEYGLVGTYVSNGNAGLSHEACLYRWEGGDLKLIRRAVSEEVTKTEMADGVLITTIDTNRFHHTVYDYTSEVEGEQILTYLTPMGHEEYIEYIQAGGNDDALWRGLR